MALPLVISQILAEANRVYFECMKNTDVTDDSSLSWKMTDAYQDFETKLETIFNELYSAVDCYVGEINGLTDTNFSSTYLHIQASVPRKSNGDWQLVHPNQINQPAIDRYFMDKGRIHCVGLSGSYQHSALNMKIKMLNDDYIETKDKILYTLPIAYGGNAPPSYSNSFPFWHAYNFFSGLGDIKPASHAVGKFYYFERYGYLDNSKKLQFFVKGDTPGLFYSTALAWESSTPHEGMRFSEGM